MNIEYNKSLLELNSFHLNEYATEFVQVQSEKDLLEILHFANSNQKEICIIGGGSNILLTKKLDALVLHNQLKGHDIIAENEEGTDVRFMSGEVWHQCVLWSVEQQLGGMENLSLIPGTIGAAPIQNIGAYGVELKDIFVELEAIHLQTLEKVCFRKEQCGFGYRDSIFKSTEKNRYFIISVTVRLQKKPMYQVAYGDIQSVLQKDFDGVISIKNISDAVIQIRKSKLPDPDQLGNAGSFFKNPIITVKQADELSTQFPEMPRHQVENGIKIPAAWLIEQCNWKGHTAGKYGVHTKQALVLVNYKDAKGSDILALSEEIITTVQQRFNIHLEREVNIW
ncbi:MAG: UDP-N-acetylmuramate dehydrogenase [Bacteroidetes bacterium]|nr:UDP-N-acetylmuramate dehydrogenase [Bacteroidota bacterium]